ncbi:hypothetical protein CNMCM6936_006582 [Aspergillus lentulus]|uniref:NB-ARC domain-containing protein n=1 Tax=Aspergillus lentulus TaxID=293939 RepID=A0AAN6BPD0_ASPLE|nr:hypothetical protein CNMCM6069_004282 [Aspergillus lentulus]KAF4166382.1 hypothetical protein CNMCM6936_006582 [Aspergillus lentulus]KAF4204838.1 hypothetical protein CNMCM8927_006990 [Aspergillus lentulus]
MFSSLAKLVAWQDAQRLTPHERANTGMEPGNDIIAPVYSADTRLDIATEENRGVYKLKSRLSDVELVPFYTGRCDENAQIQQLFQQGRSRITVVLSGLGGIGKTQIALKYAAVHESEYDAIYWVNYRSIDTVKQSLFAVAERIHHQNPFLPGWKEVLELQDIKKTSLAVIDWLSQTHNDRWLVICDGYGQGPIDDSSLENWNLHEMIRTNHGHILITSRWPQSDGFHHISVEKFTDMSLGVDLLLECSKKPTLRDDKLEFGDAVRILYEHAMIELHGGVTDNRSGSIGFRIHNCVHSWTIHVLNKNWDYGISSLALGCIASTVPHDGTSYWHISQRLLAHANRVIDLFHQEKLTKGYTVGQVEQIQTIINFFLTLGRPGTVREMCISLYEQLEESIGDINTYRHPTTLMLAWDMIQTLSSLGNYDQAEIWCNRALSRLSDIPNGRRLKRLFIYLMARNNMSRGQTEKGTQLLIAGLDECQDEGISAFPSEEYLMPAIWVPYLFKEMPTDLQTWLGNYMNQQGTVTMDNHQPSFKYLCTQIYLFLSRHDNGTAKALLAEAREIFDRVDSADYAKACMFPTLMALYIKLEDQREIQSLCEAAFTGDWETLWQSDSEHSFLMAFTRIYAHVTCCQFDKAVIACQKTLDKLKESQVPCPVLRFDVLFMLGSVFIAQGRVFDAEEHLTAAIDLTAAIIGQAENTSYRFKRLTDMMDYVRECYEQQGNQAGAQRCLKLVQGCRSERLGTDT